MKLREKLSKETKEDAIELLRTYLEEDLDMSIGHLQGDMLLDFILDKIGPSIYNQGISDIQKHMTDKVEEFYELML